MFILNLIKKLFGIDKIKSDHIPFDKDVWTPTPTNNTNREDAEKSMSNLMSSYKQNIEWNDEKGEVLINPITPKKAFSMENFNVEKHMEEVRKKDPKELQKKVDDRLKEIAAKNKKKSPKKTTAKKSTKKVEKKKATSTKPKSKAKKTAKKTTTKKKATK